MLKKIKRQFVRVHRLHLYFIFFLHGCFLRIDMVRLMKVIVHKKALRIWAPTPLFRLHRFKGLQTRGRKEMYAMAMVTEVC